MKIIPGFFARNLDSAALLRRRSGERREMTRSNRLAVIMSAMMILAPLAAQGETTTSVSSSPPSDGDASAHVPKGTAYQMIEFNTCILVTNSSGDDAQYEFGSAGEWADFATHPNPGVTHSACQVTVASTNPTLCPAGQTCPQY